MSKKYRLILLLISLSVLLIVGWSFNKDFSFVLGEFWFTSGLLLLVLLSLIDQPHFSTDSNTFVNSVTGFLSLLLVPTEYRNCVFSFFVIWMCYLAISSFILLWYRKNALGHEPKAIQFFSRFNRELGKPGVIFSVFFFWGILLKYGLDSREFNALFCFWLAFYILNIPSLAKTIENLFDKKSYDKNDNVVGMIFGIQSRNTFLIKVSDNKKVRLHMFDFVQFQYSMDEKKRCGLIIDVYYLNQEQWIKVLSTSEIEGLFTDDIFDKKMAPDIVYKIENPDNSSFLERFIGIEAEKSSIEKVNFIYSSKVEIKEGQLVEIKTNGHKVLYQIVQGIVHVQTLENKNETGYIIGEAVQLGEWVNEKGRFQQYGWVPNINTPVLLASNIDKPNIGDDEIEIGSIPGTNYPVILNKELAVTHHTAILGVTGAGKSVFARNLIREIASDSTKVIIVDLTGEYYTRYDKIQNIISEQDAKKSFRCNRMDCN